MGFSHTQFAELIARVAPELTQAESLAVRAVAWHETNYGSGWKTPEALASRNLGAITRQPVAKLEDGSVICEPPNFAHGDSLRDEATGKVLQYQTCFAGYENFEAAAEDVVREVLKENVRSFANRGSLRGVAKAMRKNRYYLGTAPTEAEQVDAYHAALERAVADITEGTGEPNPFGEGASLPVAVSLPSSELLPRPPISEQEAVAKKRGPGRTRLERRMRAAKPQAVSPDALAAKQRLSMAYLQNVPESYLHMAIAVRNLGTFSQAELRAELERRDAKAAFPDPSQLLEDLEQLEEEALDLLARGGVAGEDDELFEGETAPVSTVPPPSGSEPVTAPDTPNALEKEQNQ